MDRQSLDLALQAGVTAAVSYLDALPTPRPLAALTRHLSRANVVITALDTPYPVAGIAVLGHLDTIYLRDGDWMDRVIALHELGHCLGLPDTDNRYSVMWGHAGYYDYGFTPEEFYHVLSLATRQSAHR